MTKWSDWLRQTVAGFSCHRLDIQHNDALRSEDLRTDVRTLRTHRLNYCDPFHSSCDPSQLFTLHWLPKDWLFSDPLGALGLRHRLADHVIAIPK